MSADEPGAQAPAIQVRFIGRPRWQPRPGGPWLDLAARQAAVLLLAAHGRRTREQAAALLWPEDAPQKADDSLRNVVSVLSRRCERRPFTSKGLLQLTDDVVHDLAPLFAGDAALPQGPLLPRGELLEGLDFSGRDDFLPELLQWRRRWAQLGLRQMLAEAARCERIGHGEAMLAIGERLVEEHAQEESAWAVLMRSQYLLGRAEGAREAFRACQRLRADAGLGAVSAALRSLALQIDLGQPLQLAPVPDGNAQLPDRLGLPQAPLGRETELAAIESTLLAGQPLWLRGEPGIGKSHLLRELARRHPGWVLLELRQPEGAAPPGAYAALQQLLRALWQWQRPDLPVAARAELARLLPEFGEPPTRPTRLPALLAALRAALQAWAGVGLQALLIDDAHAIDGASAPVLASLLPGAAAVPAWLLASRGQALPEPLPATAAAWQPMDLVPLDEAAVLQVLQALRLPVFEPRGWARLLLQHTLGNPQTLQQTLLALVETAGPQVLRQPPPAGAAWPLPPRGHELVQLRVRGLDEAPRQLLKIAALVGGPLPVALACELMHCTDLALAEHWERLERAKLLDDLGLAHATLREPIAALVPAPVARSLHARIAAWCEAQGEPAATVAAHWQAAACWPEAAAAAERAAAAALRLNARAQAVQWLDAAADAHERAGARAAAFAARVQGFDAAVEVEAVAACAPRAQQLQQRAEAPLQHLQAALAQARLLAMGYHFDQVVALIDKALPQAVAPVATLAPVALSVLLRLHSLRAMALAGCGRADEAAAALKAADALLAAADEPRLRMNVLTAQSSVHTLASRVEPAIATGEQALAIARELDDAAESLVLAANLAGLVSRRGDCRRSRELFLDAQRWYDESGPSAGLPEATLRHGLATMALRLGRYREALAELQRVLEMGQQGHTPHIEASARLWLTAAWLELGQPGRAEVVLGAQPVGDDARSRGVHALGRAMLLRHAGQATAPLLLPLRPELQRLSLPLTISLDLGLAQEQPAEEAVATCRAVAQAAAAAGMRNFVLAARLREAQAWWRAGNVPAALPLLRELLAAVPALQPGETYLPAVWWLGWQVLGAAGAAEEAAQVRAQGVAWIEQVARQHVPPELQPGFLGGNPVNRALLP